MVNDDFFYSLSVFSLNFHKVNAIDQWCANGLTTLLVMNLQKIVSVTTFN